MRLKNVFEIIKGLMDSYWAIRPHKLNFEYFEGFGGFFETKYVYEIMFKVV